MPIARSWEDHVPLFFLPTPSLLTRTLPNSAAVAEARPLVRSIKDQNEFNKLVKHHAANTGLPVVRGLRDSFGFSF